MKPHPQLQSFLEPYDNGITDLTLQLRQFILREVTKVNELIWDNYNAVAIAYSKSQKLKDAFCHLSVYTHHVNFGFNRGVELTNRGLQLEGKGKLIRHLSVYNFDDFPQTLIRTMLHEAVCISEHLNPELKNVTSAAQSIVKSISKNKRRPNLPQS